MQSLSNRSPINHPQKREKGSESVMLTQLKSKDTLNYCIFNQAQTQNVPLSFKALPWENTGQTIMTTCCGGDNSYYVIASVFSVHHQAVWNRCSTFLSQSKI